MAAGEPGLPREFVWRGRTVRITAVLRTWRETGPCRHGSPERYVRKHWYEVATDSGGMMKIYFGVIIDYFIAKELKEFKSEEDRPVTSNTKENLPLKPSAPGANI